MSPVESQAVCMGCLVNPPYNPHNPYFAPIYSQHYEPWPDPVNQFPVGSDLWKQRYEWSHMTHPRLKDEEKEVLALLAEAWDKFNKLEEKHPSDNSEFIDSIHRAQQIIALRVARRANPEVWRQPD